MALMALTILLLASFALHAVLGARVDANEEQLIGWRGDSYTPKKIMAPDTDVSRRPWIQTISWKPRSVVYHNFLSDNEAKHIIDLARYQMKRSTVVGQNNTSVVDTYRTSAGTFLRRNQDAVVTAIENRLANWIQLPPIHQEDMQVLRYGPTNNYGPHQDGLGRIITVLMYLVEPEEGGETTFTNSEWVQPGMAPPDDQLSACAKGHVAFKPKRGDALLFFDRQPDYLHDDLHSMHTGCPVVKGVKWNAVKWMHGVPFQPESFERTLRRGHADVEADPGVCKDLLPQCKLWADNGECQKNSGFMVGKPSGTGQCRKACGECVECAPGDEACLDENRRRGEYMTFDDAEFKFS